MRMKKFSILLLLLAFLFTTLTFGQSYVTFKYEREQIVNNTKFKMGPFRIYPSIQLRDIGYDNNVYGERDADDPVSDYTATISPRARAALLFRNFFIFSITENPEYVYFFQQKGERGWNNILSLELKLLILNRFVLTGNFLNSDRRYRITREFNVRANAIEKEYIGRFFYETARLTSFGISGSINRISFEDITLPGEEILLSRLLNREERSGNFEFYYRILSESFFFLNGGYTEYNFEHITSQWRNSYSYQVYSGIRFPLTGRVRGALALGYKRLMPKKLVKKGFSGIVGNTNLDFRIRRFGFRLQYDRDCLFSTWSDSVFFLENRYGMGISFYLTQFLRLDYDFSYATGSYPELTTIRFPDESYGQIERKDSYHVHTAGIVFRIVRNIGIGITTVYWDRKSNVPGEERQRWFIGAYMTYDF
jgi:hypothetical protein